MPINPDLGSVHVNRPLTQISVAFLQDPADFVADKVWPNIPVDKKSDDYWIFDRTYWLRDDMAERAPDAETQGVGYKVSTTPYNCTVFGLHHPVPDQVRANADPQLDLDREGTSLLAQKALIKREKTFAAKAFNTSNWTLNRTGVTGAPANAGEFTRWNVSTSDPVGDVIKWKREVQIDNYTGKRPNGLIVGQEVVDALMTNPSIIDRLKYGQTPGRAAEVTMEDLRQLFKLEYFLVGSSVEVTSNDGAASVTAASIIGKRGLIFYRPPSAGLMTPSSGYTFSWRGLTGMSAMGHRIKQYYIKEKASTRIELEMAYDQKIISADLGIPLATMVT